MTTTYDIAPMPDESRVVITFKGKSIGWLPPSKKSQSPTS